MLKRVREKYKKLHTKGKKCKASRLHQTSNFRNCYENEKLNSNSKYVHMGGCTGYNRGTILEKKNELIVTFENEQNKVF